MLAILSRVFPHLPNATPITALAIVAGSYIGKKNAIILPIIVLGISDLFIGLYDARLMLAVYGSFACIGLASAVFPHKPLQRSLYLAVGASVFFYLTTNFAVWLFSPWYEKSIYGLLLSYELALPFARNMLLGDIGYTILLIALCEAVAYCARIVPDKLRLT